MIASAYPRLVLDTLAPDDQGLRAVLLSETGLCDPRQEAWPVAVELQRMMRILANAERLSPPGWHLVLAPRLDTATHGALGFAAASAPTLAAAVDTVLTYGPTRFPFLRLVSSESPVRVRLELQLVTPLRVGSAPLLELATLAIASFVNQLAARDPEEMTIFMPGLPPPYLRRLQALTPARLRFTAAACALEWPRSWQSLPPPLADEALHRLSLARCRELYAREPGQSPVKSAVLQAILASGGRPPSLAELAAAQHVSTRTLIRRLKRSGTSYQRLVDQVRSRLAGEWLRDTDLPLAEIAHRLGFTDASNFSRAFRKWYGCAPGVFRGSGSAG
jgi:AraC-like DNA-binding protein